MAAPSPAPVTVEPHLLALISCGPDEPGNGIFEVVFRRGPSEDDEQVARNVSPFTVDPGRFTYRLVRGELEFADYGTVVAHCRIDRGPVHRVPFTLLPPVEPRAGRSGGLTCPSPLRSPSTRCRRSPWARSSATWSSGWAPRPTSPCCS